VATYVLVHGAFTGSWIWDRVIPLLRQAGHTVIAPDLPGHGQNLRTGSEAVTLQDYTGCVVEVLDNQRRPVILAGHSLGGLTISQAAEYRPHKVRKLVYLCAFLLKNGQCAFTPEAPALKVLSFSDQALKDINYGDCTDEDFNFIKSRLVPMPERPGLTPLSLSAENFGRVPRVYITCLLDRAILPEKQREMYTALPCEKVIEMNTSHSPMISAPADLARHLISLA
jgi:pimeloyl-ACP methyl ester carboxylesterase